MSPAVPTNLRVLNLFFDLLSSERGRTKEQLRGTSGYAGLSDSAFESRFQRDKDALRASGVVLDLVGPPGAERYRVSPASFPGSGTHLTPIDLSLVHMAVRAWSSVPTARQDVLMSKLRARTVGDGPGADAPVVLDLEGAEVVATVMDALDRHQPLGFTYTSASGTAERAVEPWRLVLRGRALYLWGWDLDREAPRLFRLSRIHSGPERLGEPGDAQVPPEDLPDPFEELVVSPRLRVRAGAAHEVRLRATGIHEGEDGWDVVDGAPDEIHSWISAVLPVATDVVVLGPAALRDEVLTRLRAARDWHRAGEGHHA